MHEISWNEKADLVIGKMYRLGIIILAIDILFEFTSGGVFRIGLAGMHGTYVLSISCRVIISGFWFIRKQIRNTLRKVERLYPRKINE
jgi:hypothetical protein